MKKTIEYYKNDKCDRKEEVKHLLESETADQKVSIVKLCLQNTTAFAACRVYDKNTKKATVVCKIVTTATNLKWNKYLYYEIYDEENCPEAYHTCPSSILKRLSVTTNAKAKAFRENSRYVLEDLAIEKLDEDSLTNLPIGSEIALVGVKNANGEKVVLEKVFLPGTKFAQWQTTDTCKKYKKCDIQSLGYDIISRG